MCTFRTPEEIAATITAFTTAQWAQLRMVAARYARPFAWCASAMTADDLIQEAIRRALEGSRRCPSRVDVVRFLKGVMRSIASGEVEGGRHRPLQEDCVEDPPDPALNPEDHLAREQHAAAIRRDVLALFDDDPLARQIVEGKMEGFTAEELRERTGLDEKAYDTKLTLIRRRIYQAYPNGWKL